MQLHVAGFVVRLEADRPDEMTHLREALSVASRATGDADFVLRSVPGAVPHPVRPPDCVAQHMSFWAEGDSDVVATQSGCTARVWRGRALLDPGSGGARAIHALLLPVLSLLVAQRNACLAHGAAVLLSTDPEAPAFLVVGGSGRGKSTLVAATLSRGVGVLSDDLLVLRCRSGRLEVSGVPQPLSLPADQQALPVAGHAIPNDPRGRLFAAAGHSLVTGSHPVAGVLLVEHSTEAGGHLNSATASEVLRWVLASTVEGLNPGTARHSFPYAAAAARMPAWRLGHAADPLRRIPAAVDRLEFLSRARVPTG